MNLKFFIVQVALLLELVFGLGNNQSCEFEITNIAANGIDGPEDSVFTCKLSAFVDDESNQNVNVDTIKNSETNNDVKAVEVLGHHTSTVVKFIPFSIFKVFPFLEYFIMTGGSPELEDLKPGFFTGAEKLRVLRIEETSVSELVADLFENAQNLEFINLSNNKIKTVDKGAFDGLLDLKSIALDNNEIENLHPKTFSYLDQLEFLSLTGNKCIDQKFQIKNGNFKDVEAAIWKSCKFDDPKLSPPSTTTVRPLLPSPKILEIQEKFQKLDEKLKVTDAGLENIKAQMSNSELHKKDLNKKIEDLTKALEDQRGDLQLVTDMVAEIDSEKVKEVEKLLKTQIGSNVNQFLKISEQIEDLTIKCGEVDPNSGKSIQDLTNKVKDDDAKILIKIEEHYNSTQKQFVVFGAVAENVKLNQDCCLKATKDIEGLKQGSSPGGSSPEAALKFRIDAMEFRLNKNIKRNEEETYKNDLLLARVKKLEMDKLESEGENL